jgi:2-keto-4-pentenoate hydratase/2-oxohepta-3-ene-1,7-dioic acid hydratase in catechol pathway
MRLLTFTTAVQGEPHLGALAAGDTVVDLTATGSPRLYDSLAFLDGGEQARAEAERALADARVRHPLAGLSLLAPVPVPRSIRDCMVFEEHIVQATRTVTGWHFKPLVVADRWMVRALGRGLIKAPAVWYEHPVYYKSNRFSVVGPGADVRIPRACRKFDYELEIGIFIGRKGRDIPRDRARQHIGGFTIFNDFSARDIQMREITGRLGPAKGKDFDTGNAMGPWLVTPDELPDPYALTMTARVNGEERSRGTTADMHYTWEDVIAYVSEDETLHPGEFIGSGTVGGGCGLEQDRYLAAGDVVELEVERLGALRNRVVGPGDSPAQG